MSTTYRPIIVGLVSPGLFWLAASVAHGQGTSPKPQGLPAVPAPLATSAARPVPVPPTGARKYAVLLLNNGTVIRGEITDDPIGGVYRLKTTGGMATFPKTSVRRVGQSVDDLYRYQVAALPVGDPEERMKLVRWCITEHLQAEAREQLADVLQLCPEDAEAARMAANLDAAAENRTRDSAIRQTSGELPDGPGEVPNDLPPAIRQKIRHGFNNALPEIFDLPPAQAVTRASKFAEEVQPILQKNCQACHNEKYQGEFQLVRFRTRKEAQSPDIARANLDAVLRLVNPDDLGRSDLLSAGLVPHGSKQNPIFRGADDPEYRRLSHWVESLRPTSAPGGNASRPAPANRLGGAGSGDGVEPTSYTPRPSGGFGSDRPGRDGEATSTGIDRSGDRPAPFVPPGARRTVNEVNEAADFSKGQAADFPVPFSVGGVEFERQAAAKAAAASANSRRPTPRSHPPSGGLAANQKARPTPAPGSQPNDEPEATATNPADASTTATPVGPSTVAVDVHEDFNHLPGMEQPKYPSFPKAGEAEGAGEPGSNDGAKADPKASPNPDPSSNPTANPAAKPKTPPGSVPAPSAKKKPNIDPAALEKLMRSRAGGS